MAKKKVSHPQSHDHNLHEHDAPHPHHHTPHSHSHQSTNMDDPSDQLEKLKNLNSLLVKETAERRQQVDSLTQDKEALESAFSRSAMEKRDLEFQLSEAADGNASLHLDKAVVLVYVQTQVREMGFRFHKLVAQRNEIESAKSERDAEIAMLKGELCKLTVRLESERDQLSRLSRERDDLKVDFDGMVDEANRLKERVIEAEKAESRLRSDLEKLRVEGDKLTEEKDEKERAIRELTKERDFALRKSAESARLIDELKGEIGVIMRAKCETEEQKHAQELKISGLELELKKLNESLNNSREEEAIMRNSITEYEKSLGQAFAEVKNMEKEIDAMRKEIMGNEQSIKMLTERRDGLQKDLDMAQKEVDRKQHIIDDAIRRKNETEQAKIGLENEIAGLNREMDQLKDAIHKLELSCRDLEEKNKQLLSEVERYGRIADEAISERDNIRKGFDEEKDKVKNLILEVAEMKNKIEHTATELGEMRSEREKLIQRNEMMESRVNTLTKEKDVLQESLLDAQRNTDDLRAKIECSSQTLALLRRTAALVCHSKDDENVEEVVLTEKLDEELVPYAEELDAIKNAFKNKNKIVEDMKQQLVSLENCAAEAQKRKGLWALISSVTTIFAAALAAYAARAR
ncbi:paramyosin [Neltuma alba]|uniref:paramyosin n=1 Tax=Neltuma alba TaxID=207710 RepID=UPI0010A2F1E6|nr:paramyosin [Prosopis alba]